MRTSSDPLRIQRLAVPESRAPELPAPVREIPGAAAEAEGGESSAWDVLERMRRAGHGPAEEDVADRRRRRDAQLDGAAPEWAAFGPFWCGKSI